MHNSDVLGPWVSNLTCRNETTVRRIPYEMVTWGFDIGRNFMKALSSSPDDGREKYVVHSMVFYTPPSTTPFPLAKESKEQSIYAYIDVRLRT